MDLPRVRSASEKTFDRADLFKRHLISHQSVNQTPSNNREKSINCFTNRKISTQIADATGKCSLCSAKFENAQEFYDI